MPYIPEKDRAYLDPVIRELSYRAVTPGKLTYAVTRLLSMCFGVNDPTDLKYDDLATAMGVLSCVQHEFYRRVGAPKEDAAIEKNGDMF